MTLKIHLLLALIVWVGFAPYAWAEEKAKQQEDHNAEFESPPDLKAKAEKGDPESQFRLGFYHRDQDLPQAIKWFRKAADQGHVSSQKKLGNMYLFGEDVPKDEAEGLKWYRKAAEQGDADSIFYVGACYDEGLGVPKDKSEAAKWWLKGAHKGDDGCQVNLGVFYMYGWGVPKNETEAVKWFRKAADKGNATAQSKLSFVYKDGITVPKDDVMAYKWILLAGAQAEKHRVFIKGIENELTPEQRAEGQKLAREFKPVVQK